MSWLVKKELGFDDIVEYYWTDSQVVFGYLRNIQKRFKVFVANRVQQIRESSDVLQWPYIFSKMNPADYASRGLTRSSNEEIHVWFNGPEFLWKSEFQWLKQTSTKEIQVGYPEVRAEVKVRVIALHEGIIERLESLFSDWTRMKRVVAWILMYRKNPILRARHQSSGCTPKALSPTDLHVSLLEYAQEEVIR